MNSKENPKKINPKGFLIGIMSRPEIALHKKPV